MRVRGSAEATNRHASDGRFRRVKGPYSSRVSITQLCLFLNKRKHKNARNCNDIQEPIMNPIGNQIYVQYGQAYEHERLTIQNFLIHLPVIRTRGMSLQSNKGENPSKILHNLYLLQILCSAET